MIYRHVDGITTGMDVEWSFEDRGDGTTLVRIVHEWADGPRWPLPRALRRLVADAVIGPVFIPPSPPAPWPASGARWKRTTTHLESAFRCTEVSEVTEEPSLRDLRESRR